MSTIWIVEGRSGEYSDRREWAVCWCETESEANVVVAKCREQDASLTSDERHAQQWTDPEDDALVASRKTKLTADPQWRNDYTGVDYSCYPLDRWSAS